MKSRFTKAAATEFDQSVDYLIEHAPHIAKRFSESIDKAIEEITEYPYSTQQTEKPDVFRKYVRAFRYSIFYTIDTAADELVILSIRHAARRWPWQD